MSQRGLLRMLSQHQLGAVLATGVDYSIMILCVSVLGLTPVVGTILGAFSGAVTSFTVGRRWVFDAKDGDVRGQALRYALVSALSLCFNAGGEGLLVRTGLHYVAARVIIGVLVGVGWNFPMHRWFVFSRIATRE